MYESAERHLTGHRYGTKLHLVNATELDLITGIHSEDYEPV